MTLDSTFLLWHFDAEYYRDVIRLRSIVCVSGPDDHACMLNRSAGRRGGGPDQGVSDSSRVACMPRIIEVEHNMAHTDRCIC